MEMEDTSYLSPEELETSLEQSDSEESYRPSGSESSEPDEDNKKKADDLADRQKRFDFLIKRTEIYSHFVTKSNSIKQTRRLKRNNKNNGSSGAHNDINLESLNTETYRYDKTPNYIANGEMRDYQIEGLNWLISLYENGINGILADDMGLGKTLQVISLLGYLKHNKKIRDKHLVIVPKSTLNNWLSECKRWCPSLKCICLIGEKTVRTKIITNNLSKIFDVCITTYEMVRIEFSFLKKINWNCVVLDEGHKIKNEKTVISKHVHNLKSTYRLILTGTPLQNNLHEIWALLNFLLPDIFNSDDDFDAWFNNDSCLKQSSVIIDRLHDILRPFLLRRCKRDVEKSLLPKLETKILIGSTKMQIEWCRKILTKNLEVLHNPHVPAKRLDNTFMAFRQCAAHPYIFGGAEPGPPYVLGEHIVNNSGKMIVLDKLLKKLKDQGSRVLIFCQFIGMLNILEDFCFLRKYEYCRIDGQTPHENRSQLIDEFNAENSTKFIFMISTRAGGLGINLQTADSVIIYSPDWNPQVDLQAMDRAHRIGQKKQVRVFRFISKHTVDERIEEISHQKLVLDHLVLQQGLTKEQKQTSFERLKEIILFTQRNLENAMDANLLDEDIDSILARGEHKEVYEYNHGFSMNNVQTNVEENNNIEKSIAAKSYNELLDAKNFIFIYASNWTVEEYKIFLNGIEKYGPYDILSISRLLKHKTFDETYSFAKVLDNHYHELKDFKRINSLIEIGKKNMPSEEELKIALNKKLSEKKTVSNYTLPHDHYNDFTEADDKTLMISVNNLGFDTTNVFVNLKKDLKKNSVVLASNFLKQRSVEELERRCYLLLNLVVHEVNDFELQNQEKGLKVTNNKKIQSKPPKELKEVLSKRKMNCTPKFDSKKQR